MSLNTISPGNDVPNIINVIIEIPAHSSPVKKEILDSIERYKSSLK